MVLNGTRLRGWDSIEALSLFPRLREVKVQETEGFKGLHDQQRRRLMIARLSKVRVLNGSEIGRTERDGAERSYLRHHKHDITKPCDYERLVRKHGEVADLVEIDLSAPETVVMRVMCRDPDSKQEVTEVTVNLRHSIQQLREEIATRVFAGVIPSKELRLFYVDKACGDENTKEPLTAPDKQMFSYRPSNGDEIHVERKHLHAVYY